MVSTGNKGRQTFGKMGTLVAASPSMVVIVKCCKCSHVLGVVNSFNCHTVLM